MKNPHRKSVYEKLTHCIKNNRSFFIAGHRRPDGDSIAAQLVLADMLIRLGKKAEIYSVDPVPRNLRFLPGVSRIRIRRKVAACYDAALIVECTGQGRMGNIIDLKKQVSHVVNIDHHAHFNAFGDVNLINPDASSSCEQVHELMTAMKMKISRDNALCLYTGVVTDTGCFRHANTSSFAHQLAAQYISQGVSPSAMHRCIYQQKSLEDLQFWGRTLSRIKTFLGGKVAVMEIPPTNADTEDIINFGMMMSAVCVTVLLQPLKKGRVRVSLRSREPIDVGKIALSFGGGGHMRAAGCTLQGTLTSARRRILALLKKNLSKNTE